MHVFTSIIGNNEIGSARIKAIGESGMKVKNYVEWREMSPVSMENIALFVPA